MHLRRTNIQGFNMQHPNSEGFKDTEDPKHN